MIRLIIIGVAIVLATWYALSLLFPKPKEEKKEEKVKTPLERIKEFLNLSMKPDEISHIIRSISEIGEDLLYGHKENEVTRGIIDQYRVYLDGYLENAASLASKYRKAEKYLTMANADDIQRDVEMLERKVKEGNTALEKTLKEELEVLKDMETIRKNWEKTLTSLMEIKATLLSLQASVISVETGDKNERDAREDMQMSISTLSQALDKTFEELEEEEVFKKQKVETV